MIIVFPGWKSIFKRWRGKTSSSFRTWIWWPLHRIRNMYIHFRAGKLRIVIIIHRIKEIWKEKTNKEDSEFTAVYREAEIEKFGKLKKIWFYLECLRVIAWFITFFFQVSLPGTGFLIGVNRLNSWWSRSRNGNYKAPTVDYRLAKPHIEGSGMCQWGSFFFSSHTPHSFLHFACLAFQIIAP